MFKLQIANGGIGYQINFGNYINVHAKNDIQAINVLKHYFMKKHNKKDCPSCFSDNLERAKNYYKKHHLKEV